MEVSNPDTKQTTDQISDEACEAAINAWDNAHKRVQAFTFNAGRDTLHIVRDLWLSADLQVIWKGGEGQHAEMTQRCRLERMRLALEAAREVQAT
jgi:hypothetical protein